MARNEYLAGTARPISVLDSVLPDYTIQRLDSGGDGRVRPAHPALAEPAEHPVAADVLGIAGLQGVHAAHPSDVRGNARRGSTGDEPMTGAVSHLHTLAQEAEQLVPDELSKADASKLIDDLQGQTGRGR